MENIAWIFDGIGTAIVSVIFGVILGGTIGYKVGVRQKVKQSQMAGNNSTQNQIGNINKYGDK